MPSLGLRRSPDEKTGEKENAFTAFTKVATLRSASSIASLAHGAVVCQRRARSATEDRGRAQGTSLSTTETTAMPSTTARLVFTS